MQNNTADRILDSVQKAAKEYITSSSQKEVFFAWSKRIEERERELIEAQKEGVEGLIFVQKRALERLIEDIPDVLSIEGLLEKKTLYNKIKEAAKEALAESVKILLGFV